MYASPRSFLTATLLAASLLLSEGGPTPTPSTQTNPTAAFASLQAAVQQISTDQRFPAAQVDALKANVSDLKVRYKASGDISTGYVSTLSADASALHHAALSPTSQTALELFASAQKDIGAKSVYAAGLAGASTGVGNDISVVVTTVRSGKSVSGYFVRANALALPNQDPPLFIFGSPTMTQPVGMPPGYYAFWVVHKGVRGKFQEEQIGNVLGPMQSIVLDADVP